MRLYQKCPVCDGTGLVSKPPGIAGDIPTWSGSGTEPHTCRVCSGEGVIETPNDYTVRVHVDRRGRSKPIPTKEEDL